MSKDERKTLLMTNLIVNAMTWQCIKYSKSHIQLKREVGLAIYTRKQTITAVVNQSQTTKSV